MPLFDSQVHCDQEGEKVGKLEKRKGGREGGREGEKEGGREGGRNQEMKESCNHDHS